MVRRNGIARLTFANETLADHPEVAPPSGRPYGLFGLIVSVVIILSATALLCVMISALAFAAAGLVIGWQQALERFANLRDTTGSQALFLERIGVVVSLVVYAALSAAVLAAARFKGDAQWRDLIGWRPWHPLRGSRVFWLVVVTTIAYSLAADALVSRLYPPSADWVSLPAGPVWASLFVVLAVLFAPVAEEFLFRGWIYTSLRGTIGVWAGILVTAALFALAHWEKTHLYALAVFPVGVALGFLRERTGSLKASMTLHALYNAAASVLLVLGQ